MPQIRINGTMKDVITSRIYLPTYLDSPTYYFYNKRENPAAIMVVTVTSKGFSKFLVLSQEILLTDVDTTLQQQM